MKVLITRPAEEGAALATVLAARGIEALVEPLLSIQMLATPPLELAGVQAIAVTSANGARALGRAWPAGAPRLPIFAVGPASATAARAAGFTSVEAGTEDVAGLAKLIGAWLDPSAGSVLHVAGTTLAGDLAGLLAAAGFAARRDALYQANAASALSLEAHDALAQRELDAVLLFSPRTTAILVALLKAEGLTNACAGIDALCLSARVAEAASVLPFRRRRVAQVPTESALLALLD
ncbi:MAG: uroporphyrinogen-III synthase [Alphaproteobacteria bacterium]|nr:uroporphyrinogen-III synthase [Alphaproteobacteria bacterium]